MENLSQQNLRYLAFNHFPEFGAVAFKKIIAAFGSLDNFWQADYRDWRRSGLRIELLAKFSNFRKNFSSDKIIKILEKENIKLLNYEDVNYPWLLKEISSPPPLLYYQGNIKALKIKNLAIVGSREASPSAANIIHDLLSPLLIYNIGTVSGLARGIDALAHRETLRCRGTTTAVMGAGLSRSSFYPRDNYQLYLDILGQGGLILSEFSPLTPPLKQNFPQRNRIIAGLSQAVLVIEAKEKSGSLITASYALDCNREVLAVPASISPESPQGTNELIKQGARMVTKSQDILESLNML